MACCLPAAYYCPAPTNTPTNLSRSSGVRGSDAVNTSLLGELRMGYGAVVLIDGGRVRASTDPRRSGAGRGDAVRKGAWSGPPCYPLAAPFRSHTSNV